jgi:hypothetical protein
VIAKKGELTMIKSQEVTLKEIVMVKDSVIYPIILEKLEGEIVLIQQGNFYMRDIHIGNLKKIQNLILLELTEINNALRKGGIKIYEFQQADGGIKVRYRCRGKWHHVLFTPEMIRSNVLVIVCVLSRLDLKSGGIL